MKILVVEDEHRIAKAVKEGLEQEKYAVDVAFDGSEGFNSATNEEYDVIILDVMLPGMSGLDITKELRRSQNHTPILLLTARDSSRDIVQGLNAGADDYLAKPFSFEVLVARVRALMRRPHDNVGEVLYFEGLSLDTIKKEVVREGKPIKLSSKEYSLLEYLLRNPNRVLSKNNIMSHVWDFDADILPNTVEVFIAYLRAKVDRPFTAPPLIHTVRGFGYKLGEP
jgi:DNA-binding response OmpR family regulator